jgi:N-acetylglucosaminyldiphosphoundecaprenol N-acetyl-beta-D-mannosaminyltransferase
MFKMRIELLGIPVDILSAEETLNAIESSMSSRQRLQHVAINVGKFVALQTNEELKEDVTTSDIVGIDGMGIILATRVLGYKNATRVSGVDLMGDVLELCHLRDFRPYFLGAKSHVLAKAVEATQRKFPGLKFAGFHDGYFGRAGEEAIVADIQSSGADCLFIGMPTPQKERLLGKYRDVLGVPFIMGVGGGFDVLAGHVKRAPLWMQNFGFEWLYRVYQEPGRMWWRYLSSNTLFIGLLFRLVVHRMKHGRYQPQ